MSYRTLLVITVTTFITAVAADARPQEQQASSTLPKGNVEHGRYLAEHVAMCIECHSGRDASGNILQSELYDGGSIPFAPPWPNDWANRAPRNKGLPGYTDEQALRLLTQGAIGRDGKQLRPPMPRFHMTPQDAADVIAFLRSLP
jgi:mono/diheme cytochrome c family protein